MKKETDITKHELVPKHILLKKEEVDVILKKYNITINQLPKISKRDPQLRDVDVKIGDVIKIIRKSPTSGTAFYYRAVGHD